VLSQIYVALIASLLLAFQKYRSKIGLSLQNLARLVQANLFRRCDIMELVSPGRRSEKALDSGQLQLLA
jgi:putative transposase